VKGITGESYVPESLFLPQGIPALCDDPRLRTAIMATLPTFDESGMVVRQTSGRDPHHGIRIFDAPAGGPQSASVAPSAPVVAPNAPAAAPRPLDKGKGAASSSSAPGGTGGSEEERRRRLRCADKSFVSDPPRSVRGLLVGPRRPTPRLRARRGASVLRHHHHWVRRHHNHHRSRRHHHHLGVISPRGTSSSTTTAAATAVVASLLGSLKSPGPQVSVAPFPLVYLLCRRVLTHPLLVRASSPSALKVAPPPPPAAAIETAPPGSHAPAGGPAAAAPMSSNVAAAEGGPTAPTATAASTTAMPLSTPSAATEEVPTAPTPSIEGDVGARLAPSRRPLRRRRRWFLGGSSGPAPSQKQRQFPTPGCCLVPIRLFMRLRRRSCGSGRRLRLNTNTSATGAPSWRSAPRRRPASSPPSGPSLSGTAVEAKAKTLPFTRSLRRLATPTKAR
jgi:hypothetical protein